MDFNQIMKDLRNKIYYPVYFLGGEESYYIDEISDYIEKNVLTDVEKEFNQSVIYGRETDAHSIISYAKRFPMMSNYQVVIVKEAQYLGKDELEKFQSYFEQPLDSTLLVINYKYKKLDKRKAVFKTIAKKGVLYESKKIYDNKVPAWINNHVKEKGYSISPKASMILAEYLGTDLGKIVNEVQKLIINIPEGAEINDALIEQNIGISKDFNIFELQNAIGKKDILKANQIAAYFKANPKDNPLIKTVSLLFAYFTKVMIYARLKDKSKNNAAAALSISPFFIGDYQIASRNYSMKKLEQIISYLREYDLKSKGVDNISTSGGELLKELLYKILH